MFNTANDGVLKVCFLLFTVQYFVKHVNCSLTSTEARTLNNKFEIMRRGVENNFISAFVKIEDISNSVRTCKCHEPSNTNAGVDQIAGQPDQSKFKEIERRNNKTLQTCIDRVAKSFHDEKKARKAFEKEMVDLVRDLTKSPVHGGWADWTQWGECSHTCGTGLMKRSRQCSNPYPGPHGNHCFGDSTDTKLCVLRECTQVDTTDGGWSGWTWWSGCSTTCNGGLRTRDRHCNNPRPSSQGRYCDGPNRDSQSCNTKNGPEPIVFFSVQWPRDSMVDDVVVFKTKVETNSGNDYSTTTGKFTCRIPGLYHFSFTFLSHLNSGSDNYTSCCILKNNVDKVYTFNSAFGKSGSYANYRSASASVYLSLDTGDTVWVGECVGWDNISKMGSFHFVGALITAS